MENEKKKKKNEKKKERKKEKKKERKTERKKERKEIIEKNESIEEKNGLVLMFLKNKREKRGQTKK